MDFSLKRYIRNDYYTYILLLMSILFFAIFILIVLFVTLQNFIANQTFNVNLLVAIVKYMIFMPIISLVLFVLFIIKINITKTFLKDCIEVDATIDKYLAYYQSRNYSKKEGTETAIRVYFNYKVNGIEYKAGHSIAKNKKTIQFFEKYKNQGNIVKILVGSKNPKKIMIKEIV